MEGHKNVSQSSQLILTDFIEFYFINTDIGCSYGTTSISYIH